MEQHTLSGELSLEQLLSAIDMNELEKKPGQSTWLLNLQDARLLASVKDVRELGYRVRNYNETSQEACRLAAVVEDDVTFGLFRVFIGYAESANAEYLVCRSESEARSWLNPSRKNCA